ncbi:DivIVA domain-containing protein [uncultured Agrococcus sp.]|uniref:DivIVA domain-containing protein n=1 Tax=uncultured Agrococcus sp. TaxID=382258 RepID=UPI0025FC3ABD|nr:DivIVA domain-containing protein [uncultured Agrococcus sp.]
MALTPDDLLTKRFEETRFRDGYDQDEVDDFLDLVANDWRSVIAERDALKEENEQLKAQISGGVAEAPVQSAPAPIDSAPAAPEPAEEQQVAAPEGPDYQPSADSSVSLLTMAQRLHDELVTEGETRRDSLVTEGEQQRDELITNAQNEAKQLEDQALVRSEELQRQFETQKASLEQQRSDLQEKIDELKSFERDYRLRLRGYIESQLRDLDRTSSLGNVAVDGDNNN